MDGWSVSQVMEWDLIHYGDPMEWYLKTDLNWDVSVEILTSHNGCGGFIRSSLTGLKLCH